MGLKNCPRCNLMLFDADTECIYCGWKQNEQTVESPAKEATIEILDDDEATPLEANETLQEQAADEYLKHREEVIDTQKQHSTQLKDIKKDFDDALKAAQKQAAEIVDVEDTIIDIEDTIEDEIIDIEDTIEDDYSPFTEDDYNRGIRYLDGKRFNLFDIITKHGVANKVSIIREIREVTETSLKDAVKLLDNSLDVFFEYQRQNPQEYEMLNNIPDNKPHLNNDAEPGVTRHVKSNIHRALAYNMIVRRGPDRKVQIIDELMRSERITLPKATEIVDDALREYKENTKSQ